MSTPPALPPKQKVRKPSTKTPPPTPPPKSPKALPDLLEHTTKNKTDNNKWEKSDNKWERLEDKSEKDTSRSDSISPIEEDLVEKLNVDEYLLWKKSEEDGPDIRGGSIDALMIQATKATKNGGG